MITVPDIMNAKEVSEYLDVSQGTLQRWRNAKRGPTWKFNVSWQVRYLKASVVDWKSQGNGDNPFIDEPPNDRADAPKAEPAQPAVRPIVQEFVLPPQRRRRE